MAQKKGQTGNPNGRPKGTPNKVTSDLRVWINDLLNNSRKKFENDLLKLEPQQRVLIFEKLLSYVIPKHQSVDVEAKIDFNTLTDEQLNTIINELTNNLNDE